MTGDVASLLLQRHLHLGLVNIHMMGPSNPFLASVYSFVRYRLQESPMSKRPPNCFDGAQSSDLRDQLPYRSGPNKPVAGALRGDLAVLSLSDVQDYLGSVVLFGE